MHRVLLAVDDSPAALRAARVAVRLAAERDGVLRAVTVVADHAITEHLRAVGTGVGGEPRRDGVAERQAQTASAVLRYVARLADEAGVPVQTLHLDGEPAREVLRQARDWQADVIVLGRSDEPGLGHRYVGSQARQVLEFAEQPVLVVPQGVK